ncbi:MAG: phosphatidylserine/phosphatidylglycerophosphate/cardiolipin synthase family protein [Chloroflexota bacterium]|nr:phosphatidylserine/phosphatidylglycerophosphate/cardiolipin synthase family protein [Chloroflexota bacterium]
MADSTGISVTFLRDGGQPPEQVAQQLASFVDAAGVSVDAAVYDCALTGTLATTVSDAIERAARRGVTVRIAYYAGPHRSPLIPPPQPSSSAAFLTSISVPTRPITGFQALMHDKYIVRDNGTSGAAVWTGSTNWTADSWSREENLILTLQSPDLAGLYTRDFNQLWTTGNIEGSGAGDGGTAELAYDGSPASVQVWFSPAEGQTMAHAVGDTMRQAQRRIVIASPVLTDGSILGALRDIIAQGQIEVTGVYDRTQMNEALRQWGEHAEPSWKIAVFHQVVQAAHLASKITTPYAPGSIHDYLHVKCIVVDDTVFAGSYNFSHSGEGNAENLVRIDSAGFASVCVTYIDELIAR